MIQLISLFLTIFFQVEPQDGIPVWLPILIIIILLLFLWWGLTRNSIPEGSSEHSHDSDDDHGHDSHAHEGSDEADHSEDVHTDVEPEPIAEAKGLPTAVSTPPPIKPEPDPEPVIEPEPIAPTVAVSAEPDDLKRIEGIGPKIESVLNEAGISTFAQVAETAVSDLERIVKTEGGVRIAFPESWPNQAKLAAAGQWEALDKLQDELQGGRVV